MFGNINKDLVPIKAHYFLFNAATGPIVPFLPIIAKQLGFSGMLVGTIYTVLPISGLIAKPLFGCLADKFRLHKTFFLIFQAIVAISMFTIYFIPPMEKTPNATFVCHEASFVEVCTKGKFSAEAVRSVISATPHSSNLSCQVSCVSSKQAYTEICHTWNVSRFCDLIDTASFENPDRFEFKIGFDMFQDLVVGSCIDIRVLNATFSDGVARIPYCNTLLRTHCLATCHDNQAFNKLFEEAHPIFKESTQSSTYQFRSFLTAAVISWIGMAVVVSIADAICFALLGSEKRKEYGKQKMWGSIGFGIFGISAGYLVDVFSGDKIEKDYTVIFFIMLIAMIFDMIVSATLKKKNPECSEEEPSIFWEIFSICREGNMLAFAWWCIGAGMCTGVVWNFLFWYTEDLATISHTTRLKTLQGLLTGVQCCLGELPFNFISGNVLRKLGHVNVMSLVLLIYAIRFMAYTFVKNPWWFLIVELLHGPTVGLCWPTAASYCDKVTPPGTKATMQGFIGAIFEGIGVSCGSLICGWLIDTYGGFIAFRVFSMGALLWLSWFWLLQLLLRKMKAYPVYHGHNHLANYANPDDAVLITMSQELQTY